jgi:hypothetical protein
MRFVVPFAALAVVFSLSACKEEKTTCTQEEAQTKVTEMMTKMQELATSHPEKLEAVGKKAQELQADLAGAANDPAKACEAVDQLIKAME